MCETRHTGKLPFGLRFWFFVFCFGPKRRGTTHRVKVFNSRFNDQDNSKCQRGTDVEHFSLRLNTSEMEINR